MLKRKAYFFIGLLMIDEKMLQKIKQRLVQTYNPLEIYVFGSYAWGHPTKDSDLDLLVVLDKYKKDRFKTMSDGYRALMDLDFFKDILVYDKDEFKRFFMDKTSLCNKVVRKGKKIYAKA